jgi:hypothetical protein
MQEFDWPIGRVSQSLILFTKEKDSFLEKVLKSLHEFTTVINPFEENSDLADKYVITKFPTIIYLYKNVQIFRLEADDDTKKVG